MIYKNETRLIPVVRKQDGKHFFLGVKEDKFVLLDPDFGDVMLLDRGKMEMEFEERK